MQKAYNVQSAVQQILGWLFSMIEYWHCNLSPWIKPSNHRVLCRTENSARLEKRVTPYVGNININVKCEYTER